MGTEVEAVAANAATTCTAVTTGTATGCAALTWAALKPGSVPSLLYVQQHPSIQVPMGLIGMLVVTDAPGSAAAAGLTTGCAYGYTAATTGTTTTPASCQVPYGAEVPLEFSEIDPGAEQERSTSPVNRPSASARRGCGLVGMPGQCGNPANSPAGNPSSTTYTAVLPAGSELHTVLLPNQWVRFSIRANAALLALRGDGWNDRQHSYRSSSSCHDRNHSHGHRPGAPGECRREHARAFDRRLANHRLSTGQVPLLRLVDSR